jgi:hypothetical protein
MMMMMMKQLERKSAAEFRRRRHGYNGRAAAVMAARWVFSIRVPRMQRGLAKR